MKICLREGVFTEKVGSVTLLLASGDAYDKCKIFAASLDDTGVNYLEKIKTNGEYEPKSEDGYDLFCAQLVDAGFAVNDV